MNRSLQAKSSARLAAVQLLYQAAVTGTKPDAEKLAAHYDDFLAASRANPKEAHLPAVAADKAYLRKLLRGVIEHNERLEPVVERALTADWKKERTGPLLLAILRLGAFELAEGKPAAAVVVDEYVALTARFFGEAETGFIHAALRGMAKDRQVK